MPWSLVFHTCGLWNLQQLCYANKANFAAYVRRPKAEKLSASGGKPPLPPDQGLCPGLRWGLRPLTPVIGSRYRGRYNPPPAFSDPPGPGGTRIVPAYKMR